MSEFPNRPTRISGSPPRGLAQRVLQRWRELTKPPDVRLIIGFSGGADSLALAICFAQLQPILNVEIRLLHVDHGLRSVSSEDAKRALDLAHRLNLNCDVVVVNDSNLKTHEGVGIEEAARRERYRLFADAAAGDDHAIIVLAHHESDQAETILLHLLRGSGLRGAAGMREWTTLTVPWWPEPHQTPPQLVNIWRPFLSEPQSALVDFHKAYSDLIPIQDESNFSRSYRRNVLRHDLLPLLNDLVSGATSSLTRFARIAAEEDEFLSQQANQLLSDAHTSKTSISVDHLLAAPRALQRRILHQWFQEFDDLEATQERIEATLSLAKRRRGDATIELGAHFLIRVVKGQLVIDVPGESTKKTCS